MSLLVCPHGYDPQTCFRCVSSKPREPLTPPLTFTAEENSALLASVSASLQLLEQAGHAHCRAWSTLNSLRTLFAENGYAFERAFEEES